MSRTPLSLLALLTVCLSAGHAAAPPTREPVRYLSLLEAVTLALENHTREVGARHILSPSSATDRRLILSGAARPTLEQQHKLNQLLLTVEVAYWNLYQAIWAWHTRERGLHLAEEMLHTTRALEIIGAATLADIEEVRAQVESFRAQRAKALATIDESQAAFRVLLGLPWREGPPLLPIDSPQLTAHPSDYWATVADLLNHRPDLALARREVAFWRWRLEGKEARLGPFLLLPRAENTKDTQAKLDKAVGTATEVSLNAQSFLATQRRLSADTYAMISANQAQRVAFGKLAMRRRTDSLGGQVLLADVLETQRFWVEALNNELKTIAEYNIALARCEFARGVITARHDIDWERGQRLPQMMVRATDKERRQTLELARAVPALSSKGILPGTNWEASSERTRGPSLASMWKGLSPAQVGAFLTR